MLGSFEESLVYNWQPGSVIFWPGSVIFWPASVIFWPASVIFCGKTLVFAMTKKLIPEFWRNQEIPEKFWKIYEQVKLDLFQDFYLFRIVFLIPEFCHPEPPPTTLQSFLAYYV